MSLVFTFLSTTNQAKAFTFSGAFDFQIKLAGRKGIRLEDLDKAMKKDLTENELVGDKHQPLESTVEEDNPTALSNNMSLSSNLKKNAYLQSIYDPHSKKSEIEA